MKSRSEKRTLLTSVMLSSPGPLILLVALLFGQSSTQIADFVRRSAELMALIVTYVTYLRVCRTDDRHKKAKYEKRANLFTGSMMCISGTIMAALVFVSESEAEGTVIPSLIIAGMGAIANGLFWRKYTKLNRKDPNAMIAVQGRLYRAKTLVDACVVCALLSVCLLPGTSVSIYLDKLGSFVVSLYLCACGIMTIGENLRGQRKN